MVKETNKRGAFYLLMMKKQYVESLGELLTACGFFGAYRLISR